MNALERALYSCLTQDAGISALVGTNVFNSMAPQWASMPFIVFSQQSGREENRTRVRERTYDYLIKAIAPTLREAGDIADAIDAALFDAQLDVEGWDTVYWVRPSITVRYAEALPSGDLAYHAGAVYTIRIAE